MFFLVCSLGTRANSGVFTHCTWGTRFKILKFFLEVLTRVISDVFTPPSCMDGFCSVDWTPGDGDQRFNPKMSHHRTQVLVSTEWILQVQLEAP